MVALAVALGGSLCPFAALTGIPCPGCGLLRATLALCAGELRAALALHPLVVTLPLVAWTATPARSSRGARARGLAAAALLAALLGVWGVRFAGRLGGPVPVGWRALERPGSEPLRR